MPTRIRDERRKPAQTRAKATIEVILEAAAQILEREGRAALNTNHIAERAGVSIGALYQYFRNKDEILVELGRRRFQGDVDAALNAMREAGREHPEPERIVIRALLGAYRKRRKSRRAAIDAIVAEGLAAERAKGVLRIAEVLSAESSLPPTAIWILTRAVNGVLRATVEEDASPLHAADFEDELVRLIRGYLAR